MSELVAVCLDAGVDGLTVGKVYEISQYLDEFYIAVIDDYGVHSDYSMRRFKLVPEDELKKKHQLQVQRI